MKKALVGTLIIIVLIGLGFLVKDLFFNQLLQIEKKVGDLLEESGIKVSLPAPLLSSQDSPDSFLTKEGIIKLTNLERQKQGLAPLKENAKLDSSAGFKAEDLFKNQYFEHESPTGVTVSDLVKKAGYDFIALGENLARGNFKDDQALVEAWMASPGHRENILNPSFKEIGVSVEKGIFEGKETWIAVQHFALPLSACPTASEEIKRTIQANEKEIAAIEETLNSLKDSLRTKKDVNQYNSLVLKHNNLIDQTQALVQEYNRQVEVFNQCLSKQY